MCFPLARTQFRNIPPDFLALPPPLPPATGVVHMLFVGNRLRLPRPAAVHADADGADAGGPLLVLRLHQRPQRRLHVRLRPRDEGPGHRLKPRREETCLLFVCLRGSAAAELN